MGPPKKYIYNMECHCWHHLIKVDLILVRLNENCDENFEVDVMGCVCVYIWHRQEKIWN